MEQFIRKIDEQGQAYLETSLMGHALALNPFLNKGTAFTLEERREFGLAGMFPTHVATLAEQVERSYAEFHTCPTNLDKYIYLRALQDFNEVLYYALVDAHLYEMLPVIYTPTVAQGVEQFSRFFRTPRGLIVNTSNIEQIEVMLEHVPTPEVQLIVATDGEGILGIGDQGVGGIAICIGKLTLYTAAAGIDPATTLAVGLDVGTNRQDLLDDPLYLGARHRRLEGKPYEEFVDHFVKAVKKRFPGVLLQWEDFSKQRAFDVLERYREEILSFNDDIQGTGAVVLAGLLSTMRRTRQRLKDQVIVIHGAGAGGIGVARQICRGFEREGVATAEAKARIFLIDSRGLILQDRPGLEAYKQEFAQSPERVAGWAIRGAIPNLLETVRCAKVTTLIGLSGQRGAFSEEIIIATAANTLHPTVFALSNPTANCEVMPEDVYQWTRGRATVATGSPFPDVVYGEARCAIGQGNNAFIFPGLGLGVLLSGAKRVTDSMVMAAAVALAESTDAERLASGGVFPPVEKLRSVSKQVAAAVIRQAIVDGVAKEGMPDHSLAAFVEQRMWKPEYLPIRRSET